jgi:hypothetical protein
MLKQLNRPLALLAQDAKGAKKTYLRYRVAPLPRGSRSRKWFAFYAVPIPHRINS